MCETSVKLHPFEERGLGKAPFRCVGVERRVGPIKCADGSEIGSPGQPMGSCDYCGTGIADCFEILSGDGKRFIVGCDCVAKASTAHADNRLLTDLERQQAKLNKAKRDAKRMARQAKAKADFEAKLQAQRDANGGLTDYEVRAKARAEEAAAKAAVATTANQWLIDALSGQTGSGGFIDSMVERLKAEPISALSPRMIQVLREVYGKAKGGRMGSKAFNAACDEFDAKSGV